MAKRTKPRNKFKTKKSQTVKQNVKQTQIVNIFNQKPKRSSRKSTSRVQQKESDEQKIIQVPQFVPQYIQTPPQNSIAAQELLNKITKINEHLNKISGEKQIDISDKNKEAVEVVSASKSAVALRSNFGTLFNSPQESEPEEGSSSGIFAKLSSPFTSKKPVKKTFPIELEDDYQQALKSYKSAVGKIEGEKAEHGTRVRSEYGSFIEKGEPKEGFIDYMLQKYHRQ